MDHLEEDTLSDLSDDVSSVESNGEGNGDNEFHNLVMSLLALKQAQMECLRHMVGCSEDQKDELRAQLHDLDQRITALETEINGMIFVGQ